MKQIRCEGKDARFIPCSKCLHGDNIQKCYEIREGDNLQIVYKSVDKNDRKLQRKNNTFQYVSMEAQ